MPAKLGGLLWLYSKGSTIPSKSHTHRELEVNLTLTGSAVYLLNGRRIPMHPGTLLWLFPAQEHLLIERSAEFEMWVIVWKPALIKKLNLHSPNKTLLLNDPGHELGRLLKPDAALTIDQLCRELQQHSVSPDLFNSGLSYLLLQCWQNYLAGSEAPRGNRVHPAVQRAAHYMAKEPIHDRTDTLAAACGLSRTRLSRLFKEQMGVSLSEFRSQQRLHRFMAIITRNKKYTLLDAALDSGFGSYAQFHRTFVLHMGKPPSDYFAGKIP
ncbi:MAG: helix-turn-helix transcriptional regulator [Verrucomicrobiota bacterium]|nr:helix-turn-helix transcriptional regulator [Verrucomicrobiota bacterium]